MEFKDLSEYIGLSKQALDLIKAGIAFLPKGTNREEAEKKVAAAEEMLRRSDVKLAQCVIVDAKHRHQWLQKLFIHAAQSRAASRH